MTVPLRDPAANPDEDCVPGLGGGLGLYGDLPASVRSAAALAGRRPRIGLTGGDDANFCFAGMGGLAGAEEARVTIDSVNEDRVEGPLKAASASGIAILRLVS